MQRQGHDAEPEFAPTGGGGKQGRQAVIDDKELHQQRRTAEDRDVCPGDLLQPFGTEAASQCQPQTQNKTDRQPNCRQLQRHSRAAQEVQAKAFEIAQPGQHYSASFSFLP